MTDTATLEEQAPKPQSEADGLGDFVQQFRAFVVTLWSSPIRTTLTWLSVGVIFVVGATVVGQIFLNAWNKPFYQAIEDRNLPEFTHQLLIFAIIASALLVLNVSQAWLRETIKLRSREALTRDLFAEWLRPGRPMRLAQAGEIGVNPDQRIHEDARHLTELSAELGIGLFQASLLLISFVGVLWVLSSNIVFTIDGRSFAIPGYMVWCALIFAITGSWFTWRVGRPLVGINAARYQRESNLRFALVQANEHAEDIALRRGEAGEQRRLNLDLNAVLARMREIVTGTTRLTWITAGYGWIAIVAPIVIAAPAYFPGKITFGELMMVVGAFFQVNNSLRWFVDNFSMIADWRATLQRVMSFREVLVTFESQLQSEDRIDYAEHPEGKLALENLGFKSRGEKAMLDTPKIDIEPGARVLIVDKTPFGKSALFSAITGHWPWGTGKLHFPADKSIMFLKRRPYFPAGSLRAALAYPAEPSSISDSNAAAALERVGLSHLASTLDKTARWETTLTGDEQARLALARLLLHKPQWVFSDNLIDVIEEDERNIILSIFDEELAKTALVTIARRHAQHPLCKRVVHLTTGSSG